MARDLASEQSLFLPPVRLVWASAVVAGSPRRGGQHQLSLESTSRSAWHLPSRRHCLTGPLLLLERRGLQEQVATRSGGSVQMCLASIPPLATLPHKYVSPPDATKRQDSQEISAFQARRPDPQRLAAFPHLSASPQRSVSLHGAKGVGCVSDMSPSSGFLCSSNLISRVKCVHNSPTQSLSSGRPSLLEAAGSNRTTDVCLLTKPI